MVERLSILLVFLLVSLSSPASVEHEHDRVLHGKPLSSKEHHDDEGDYDYDHEAFLGDEADEFDDLDPEESQRRLGVIADKIDVDKDGFITIPELQQWIKTTQARYIDDDVEKQWETNKPEEKETISWDDYRQGVYSFLDEGEPDNDEAGFSYKEMEQRDNRRWNLADTDHDGELTKIEFQSFLHPENAEHMRDIVVQETFEDIDKDKDGKISMEEYIGDMYSASNDGEEPEWVESEKEQFTKFRDSNGDGHMDMAEVKAWIIPSDFDHSEAEAKHLVFEADVDHDNKLTKEEILDKYDLFVGSQATDFGEALTRHDEF